MAENKISGGFYPKCSSTKRSCGKHDDITGTFTIEEGSLVFRAKVLVFIRAKSQDFAIPLDAIDRIERMNINFMPFGVCVFMKDGSEYMLGHMLNKKLEAFINNAIKNRES